MSIQTNRARAAADKKAVSKLKEPPKKAVFIGKKSIFLEELRKKKLAQQIKNQ